MRRVIVESPYAGDIERHVQYARKAVADALRRGEAPLASHLLYTQPGILRDEVESERALGIEAGLAWGAVADATVVYLDLGISEGMKRGIERAVREGRPVELRSFGSSAQACEAAEVARLVRDRAAEMAPASGDLASATVEQLRAELARLEAAR